MAMEPFAYKLVTIWVGGFFFWIMRGFSGKLTNQYTEKYKTRNLITGYLITLLSVFTFLLIIYFELADNRD